MRLPFIPIGSIILFPDFEIALRVVADRADLRRLGADDQMAAVAALPDLDAALFKDLRGLDIVQQRTVRSLIILGILHDTAKRRQTPGLRFSLVRTGSL